MSRQELEDYRWLVGDSAEKFLRLAAEHPGSTVAVARTLRRDISDTKSRLVLGQVELRKRGRAKFELADEMFFTRQHLEQATDDQIARYKAAKFPGNRRIVDLCCGIGGDLISLAARAKSCVGLDQSEVAGLLAAVNCERHHRRPEMLVTDVQNWKPTADDIWHLDPDRRVSGRRTTKLEACLPGPDTIQALSDASPNGAIKLAPATREPSAWADVECEWIGNRGECRQQVVWRGELAGPFSRTATVVHRGGILGTVGGTGTEKVSLVPEPDSYVFEPHAAVLAAYLHGALANRHGLARFSEIHGYLTGNQLLAEPLMSAFAVREVLPFNAKRLSKWFSERQIGQLEIKHRGLAVDLPRLRRQLKLQGDGQAVLLIVAQPGSSIAIVADRVKGSSGEGVPR